MITIKNKISSIKIKKYLTKISLLIMLFIFFSIMVLAGFSGCGTTKTPNSTENPLPVQNIQDEIMSAIITYYSGNIEGSIKLFNEILKKDPENIKALFSLVRILTEAGNHKEAIAVLSKYDNAQTNNSAPLLGSMWEDKSLPLFLAGNYEEYLDSVTKYSNSVYDNFFLTPAGSDIKSENLFFTGWAYKELGMTDKAVESFISAIETRKYFPVAHLMLGKIYYDNKNFRAAEQQFAEALRLDFNLTQGRTFLARSILAQGRVDEGYSALKRAQSIRPWDTETSNLIAELEKQYPRLVEQRREAGRINREIATAPVPRTFTTEPSAIPEVRIGLAGSLRELYIKAGGGFIVRDNSNNVIARGGKDHIVKIKFENNTAGLYDQNDNLLSRVNAAFTLTPDDARTTTIIFDVSHSTGYQTAGQEDRAYRGRLTFIPVSGQGITVVNTLNIEEYLYSVVPSEMPATWPEEALAAQAIAARSYTLANMGRFNHRGYDLSGSIISAFYRGHTGEHERTTTAIERTRGLVLKNNGAYLNTFYSANSAGRTESARSVWNMSVPIIGVTDPQLAFETNPPSPDELTRWILTEPLTFSSVPGYHFRSSYRWQLIVPREEIEFRIEARLRKRIGTITGITTMGRGSSGRVEKVLIKTTAGNEIISHDAMRGSLGGLRSNLFVILPKLGKDGIPEYFIFAGAGWGHGVGMCQSGAAGMAHTGHTYTEILNHYYPLGELVKEW